MGIKKLITATVLVALPLMPVNSYSNVNNTPKFITDAKYSTALDTDTSNSSQENYLLNSDPLFVDFKKGYNRFIGHLYEKAKNPVVFNDKIVRFRADSTEVDKFEEVLKPVLDFISSNYNERNATQNIRLENLCTNILPSLADIPKLTGGFDAYMSIMDRRCNGY